MVPSNALTRYALQYKENPTEENFALLYPHLRAIIAYTMKTKLIRVEWTGLVLGEEKPQKIFRTFSSGMEYLRAYPHIDEEDLFQEGWVMALQNLEYFDPTKSASFSSYAIWGALRGFTRFILYQLRGHDSLVAFRSPFTGKDADSFVRYLFPRWSEDTSWDIWRTYQHSRSRRDQDVGLCNRLQEKEDELWLQDMYAELVAVFWKRSGYVDSGRAYEAALRKCDAFLKMNDLLGQGKHTLQELGAKWGLTRERVRQLVLQVTRYLRCHPNLWR